MVLIGSRLGSYEILSALGSGGMAVVYKAWDPRRRRHVAIKVLTSGDDQHASTSRFEREVRVIRDLDHPHILPVYDAGRHQGHRYIVMPWVRGGTLADRAGGAPVALAQAMGWIGQVASALDHAHARGVVHRDLKPANVLLVHDDTVRLGDFGIAKLVGATTHLTKTGAVFGTPLYMSPEQAMGREVCAATDVYSLGVTAFELLTGGVPFVGETPVAVALKHLRDPVPSVRQRVAGLPADLDAVFARAMSKNPADRHPSATAFAEDLLARVRDSATTHRQREAALAAMATIPPAPPRRPPRWRLGTPTVAVAAGLGLALIGARLAPVLPELAAPGPAASPASTNARAQASPAPGLARAEPTTATPRVPDAPAGSAATKLAEAEALWSLAAPDSPAEARALALYRDALERDPRSALAAERVATIRERHLARMGAALDRGDLGAAREVVAVALGAFPDDAYLRDRAAALARRIEADRTAAAAVEDPRIVAARARAERAEADAREAEARADAEREAREAVETAAEQSREQYERQLEELSRNPPPRLVASSGGSAPPPPRASGGRGRGGGGRGGGGR